MKSEDSYHEYMDRQNLYASIERGLRDPTSRVSRAYREGRANAVKKIALRMFDSGMSVELISELIALSPEETQALLRQ